jgi:hypothetical protein
VSGILPQDATILHHSMTLHVGDTPPEIGRECTGLRFVTWRAYIVCKKVINKHTRVLSRVVPITGVYY